jgi:DNA-binding NtrC family response regulator
MRTPVEVLLVDDMLNVRKTVRHILSGFDCNFSEADSGEEALGLIEHTDFDVIFIDLKLPGISGIETYQKAKQIRPRLGKVIILTGYPGVETAIEAHRIGAFDYITKAPIDINQIRDTFIKAISQ